MSTLTAYLHIWGGQNEDIQLKINVTPIDEKMQEIRLRWYGHVLRIAINATVRKNGLI